MSYSEWDFLNVDITEGDRVLMSLLEEQTEEVVEDTATPPTAPQVTERDMLLSLQQQVAALTEMVRGLRPQTTSVATQTGSCSRRVDAASQTCTPQVPPNVERPQQPHLPAAARPQSVVMHPPRRPAPRRDERRDRHQRYRSPAVHGYHEQLRQIRQRLSRR